MNYFVYYYDGTHYVYDRTCGNENEAKRRVKWLEKRYTQALYWHHKRSCNTAQ